MKNIIILLCVIWPGTFFGQGGQNVSVFHRLIIYNAENELMLVKIKDTDVWVTPGFYQDSTQFIKEGLHDIASTYGLKISNPELSGVFSIRREVEGGKEMLLRNIYRCDYLSGVVHFPENQSFEIGDIKWLPIEEALPIISFESIRMFVSQTHENPDVVSGGSIDAMRVNGKWNYTIMEDFHPLFDHRKQK